MPLINTSVPNLIQGVSQQPDSSRYDGQCEEQENALSSVVDGLAKRPNTRHVATLLSEAITNDSFVHFIKRSPDEQYVIIHDGTKIRAYSLIDGTEATINGATGGYTPAADSYLEVEDPIDQLKALTVADSTFLLNTNIGVGYKKDNGNVAYTPALENKALVYIKQAESTVKYGVTLTGGLTRGSGATATVGLTRYLYSGTAGRYSNYRWRVSSINVTNGGSGYIADSITFNISSNASIYRQPSITFAVTNGVINTGTGHTINDTGDFQGLGSNRYSQGADAPTVTISSIESPPYEAPTSSTSDAFTESASISSHPERVQADVILSELLGDSDSDNDFYSIFSTDYNYKQNPNTNLLEIERHDGEDFHITPIDGSGGGRIGVVYKEVGSITDLPLIAPHNFVVKVKGDEGLDEDDYYVRFEVIQGNTTTATSNNNPDAQGTGVAAADMTSIVGEGIWVETVAPNVIEGIDPATMFHTLISTGVDEFVIEETNFASRLSGDDFTNPLPSFESAAVDNLFFFKNRLGLLSGDNIVMSESGLGSVNESNRVVYNFGRTTVRTLLDSDPIDISAASSRVTSFEAAVGFQENLVLFSDNSQFVLKGGDVLTPRTVSLTPVTNFSANLKVTPLALGSYLYFPFNKGEFTGLREYTVNSTTDNYDSAEVTEHVPNYIPTNVINMAATSTEDILAMISIDEPNAIYVYKYFWSGTKKLLSSWSKFTVTGEIRGIHFIDSTLYMVVAHNGETQLLEMLLVSGLKDSAGYTTYLDQRVKLTVASGAITLPYTPAVSDVIEVYTLDGTKVPTTRSGSTVTITSGASDDDEVWAGYPYTMKYTFSEQLFKAAAGNAKSPSNAAKLQLRNLSLFFSDTASFKLKVTPKARLERITEFVPDPIGSTTAGNVKLDSGSERFSIFTAPEDTIITIENDSALPSNFQSAEFEAFVHSRSNRYG